VQHFDSKSDLSPCDLCGHLEYKESIAGSDLRAGIPTSYHIYECLSCGLACLQPQPASDDMQAHYPDWLWEAEYHGGRVPQRLNVALDILQRFHPRPGILLDVGCATGEFILAAERAGWRARGIEVSERQADVALSRGADAILFPDFLVYESDTRFDAITLNHVLEHVPSPRAYLDKAISLLDEGGVLLVSVPNYNSLSRRLFGKYWTHLDIPRHLFHFTPRNLKYLVESVGFCVREIRFDGREDNSIGVRDSLRRWLRYGALRRSANIPMRPDDPSALEQRSVLKRALVRSYRIFGNLTAILTENLGIADVFILVAVPGAAVQK